MNETPTPRLPFGLANIFYGWWIVLACFFISFYVGSIIFYGFTAFFEPLVKEFGWSYTEVSFASSIRGIEMSFLSPLVGFLVDRFGSRKMVFWGVITVGVGFIILSFTQSLWMFYASFILIAFGGGGCTAVVLMRVVANWFQRDVGKAMGVMSSGFGASGLMVPVIVWLIDAFGWRLAMIILGGGMLVIGIPFAFLIRNTPEACGLYPDGRKTAPPVVNKTAGAGGAGGEVSFRDALQDRAFLSLSLSDLIRMMAISAVVTHIMPYLSLLQVSRTTAGLIAGSLAVLSIAGRFAFGWLADHFNKRYLMAIAYSFMCLGMIALCFVDRRWVLFLFLFLFPTGLGGSMVLRAAILREYFGRGAFGRLLGLVMGAAAIGAVIGPTLVGLIFDHWGSYFSAWVGLALATAFSVFLMLSVKPQKRTA